MNKNDCFQNKINKKFGENEYILKSDYINDKTEIKLLHLKCMNFFTTTPNKLIQGYGCKKCSNREKFDNKKFDKILGNEYQRLSECKNNKDKVLIKHLKCGYKYETRPTNFQQGKRCPKCSKVLKKTTKDVQAFLDENYPNEYKVIGKYINKDTPINIKHLSCDNVINPTWNNIRNKRFSCRYCIMSSGELEVSKILNELKIVYDYQHKIKQCKDKKILPFDFYFILNEKEYIIEYDGRQHFLPIFGDNEKQRQQNLKKTIKHDNIKNSFCKENNINLLRIKYDDKDIKNLIINFIN